MKRAKVGIIGCGTIGSAVAKAIVKRFSEGARIAYLCDCKKEKAIELRRAIQSSAEITSISQLIQKSDVVIEAASALISADVAKESLKLNKKVLIMSVGGLLRIGNLFHMMRQSKGRVWIPSGAVCGVDGLIAASQAKVREVKLVTRKPPRGLEEAPYFKRHHFPVLKGNEEKCVFKGNSYQAVKYFPQNINVAAVLSLAGVGPSKTKVEIWTSRRYQSNQHEVTVSGDFGTLKTVTSNIPSPQNPKTSYLAVLSAVAVLKEIFSFVEIGT